MSGWALDLGTTNTGLARWDASAERPRMVGLDALVRAPSEDDPLEAPRVVPSATQVLANLDFASRLGALPFVSRRWFIGQQAIIGRPALEKNAGIASPAFVRSFKPFLAQAPMRSLARVEGRAVSAREVARMFTRELFAEVRRSTGERVRSLTVTTPVDAFESYRAELVAALRYAGVRDVRFVDEPVAAAVGYGLSLRRERVVLVVDFGGGTLDLALVRMTARDMQDGVCEVIAKAGRPVGGNLVDQWLLAHCCKRLEYPLSADAADEDERFWYQMMLMEVSRVKEALFFRESETFYLTPPEELRAFEARIRGDVGSIDVTRAELVSVLREGGLYAALDECVDSIEHQMGQRGMGDTDIGDVLMVGGSTLLPDVYGMFERRFGRGRVRAFQPFEAVAYGACALAAGGIRTADFIVHDYALVAYDLRTHQPRYETIIPRGTRFPTRPDLWKRQLVPTCSLGEPERIFKLVIAEIGSADSVDRTFAWDGQGALHKLGGADAGSSAPLVVHLNEANPALGTLDPPHPPSDHNPRLEIAFGVNADRWLIATVRDLRSGKLLMDAQSVVQLL